MKQFTTVFQSLPQAGRILAVVLALVGQNALATMFFQDGFNYNNASRLGTNAPWTPTFANGSVIDNTALPTYLASGVSLQDFSPAGLHVKSAPQSSGYGLIYTTNMTPVTSDMGGAVYCSFLFYMTANMTAQYAFPILGLFATNKTAYISANTNASTEAFMLQCLTNGSNARIGLQVANAPVLLAQTAGSLSTNFTTLTLNTIHLVVIKYDLATGKGYLFLDPVPGSSEPANASASAVSLTPNVVPNFTAASAQGRFWIQNHYNGGGNQIYTPTFHLDSLRIASTWAEVTPAGVVPTIRNLTWQGDGQSNVWDVATTPNWSTNPATALTVFSNYTANSSDNVLFDDSATNFVVDLVGDLIPASVTVNATNDYTFTSSTYGLIDGSTGLTKTNSGTLTINSSNVFLGSVLVSGGVLRPANLDALGVAPSITITNGGTLDLNGSQWVGLNYNQTYLSRQINLSGAGYNGLGAVVNSSPNPPTGLSGYAGNSFSVKVALTGDTTINAAVGPFDIGDQYGGTLTGNGYKLTKTGPNQVNLVCNGGTGLGAIEIQQGFLFFIGGGYSGSLSNDMGSASSSLTVDAGAALGLYAPRGTNGGTLNKPWILNAPAEIYSGAANNTNLASVTLSGVGTNLIYIDNASTPSSLTLNGVISGSGSINKDGPNLLRLSGTNTYSGNTLIANGTLALGVNGRITNSPLVAIAAGAVFDVSAPAAGFTFTGTGSLVQTLAGSSASGSATIIAGTGAKAVTLATGALASFQAVGGGSPAAGGIVVLGALNLNNNVITVNVTGSALPPGTYQLLSCTNTLAGTANPTPIITGMGLAAGATAAIVTTTGSAGHVDLVVNAQPASGQVQSIAVNDSSVTMQFDGTSGHAYEIQRSTNLVNWTTIWTTNAPDGGLFQYVDLFSDLDGAPASAYYRLSWEP